MRCLKKPILLFETIKIKNKKALNLEFHEARANLACKDGLKFSLAKKLEPNLSNLSDGIYRAKLIYSQLGEFESLEIYPYTMRKFESFKLIEVNFNYEKKYLDRSLIDKAFQKRNECDEIIMIKDGLVTDTSIANIAIFDGNSWLTPKTPLLQGTTKARLLKDGFLKPCDINVDMLLNAKKFAILNAMIEFKEIEKFKFIE
ncbi:MAG: aminotransferase [Campylobacteraceae bacterium]|nr:aminotransferase [Campylobacteraceae bacterium]